MSELPDWNDKRARSFAQALADARKQARRSQRELATLSGISHTTIARLERGTADSRGNLGRPAPRSLKGFAEGLSTGNDNRVDEESAAVLFRKFMNLCGYDPTADFIEDKARECAVLTDSLHVRVTMSKSEHGTETITVEVEGADPEQCGRAARIAYQAVECRPAGPTDAGHGAAGGRERGNP